MSVTGQEYPPWITFLPTTVTNPDGSVETTSTLFNLPLTYYGPSIPLGDGWTYGGLTSPANTDPSTEQPTTASPTEPQTTETPVTTTTTTTETTSTTTTATPIPSTITIIPSSSQSSPSGSLSQSVPSSVSPSSSSATSSSTAPTTSGGLHGASLVGVIVGTVLGAAALFFLILLCFFIRRKKRMQKERSGEFSMIHPADDPEFLYITPGASRDGSGHGASAGAVQSRVLGHGSPRHSGEEADPLLQPSGSSPQMSQMHSEGPSTIRPVVASPAAAGTDGAVLDSTVNSKESKTSSSASTDYGTVLNNQTLRSGHEGQFDSDTEQDNLENGPDASEPEVMLPPRVVTRNNSPSPASTRSHSPFDREEGQTLTARHVHVSTVGPKSPLATEDPLFPLPDDESNSSPRRNSWAGMGFGALTTGLGRLFKNDSTSSRRAPPSAWNADQDADLNKALLFDTGSNQSSPRKREFGILPTERPISGISEKSQNSGGTVFHTPMSSLSEKSTALTPPPRALPITSTHEQPPPAYTPSVDHKPEPSADILDMPVPHAAVALFNSTSSRGTVSDGSSATKVSSGAPSVGFPTPLIQYDSLSTTTASPGPASQSAALPATAMHYKEGAGDRVMIDILEEEPPRAQDFWRSIAGASDSRQARRTTFGLPQYVQSQADYASEQGSLHSMRSFLSPPLSARSAGSSAAASSARRNMNGSGSSRGTRKTGSSSLAHSASISSDGRRRWNNSPALSAVGPFIPSPSLSPLHLPQELLMEEDLSDFGLATNSSRHGRSIGSKGTTQETSQSSEHASVIRSVSPPISPLPWAGGLRDDWQPS